MSIHQGVDKLIYAYIIRTINDSYSLGPKIRHYIDWTLGKHCVAEFFTL